MEVSKSPAWIDLSNRTIENEVRMYSTGAYLMRLVILESPFKAITAEWQARNIVYLKEAMAHSLHLGESPIASVLTWATSGILDDHDPAERKLGMEAGFAWYRVAEACVVYEDLGISD